MKNNSRSGFVLAETLVVAVFLMTIFGMIYYYFYPLMGEYEKREVYDSVDDKYSMYWLKKLIEDSSYKMPISKETFNNTGYVRFECRDVTGSDDKNLLCKNLVDALQVEGCNKDGNLCSIYITKYCLGSNKDCGFSSSTAKTFKETVKESTGVPKYRENCTKSDNECMNQFVPKCTTTTNEAEINRCKEEGKKELFPSGFQDYMGTLPDYITASENGARYRVIAIFQHTVDNNNYYSYATIEVIR